MPDIYTLLLATDSTHLIARRCLCALCTCPAPCRPTVPSTIIGPGCDTIERARGPREHSVSQNGCLFGVREHEKNASETFNMKKITLEILYTHIIMCTGPARANTHKHKYFFLFFFFLSGSRRSFAEWVARATNTTPMSLSLDVCVCTSVLLCLLRVRPDPLTHQRRLARARLLHVHVQIYSEGIRLTRKKDKEAHFCNTSATTQAQTATTKTTKRLLTFLFHYTITL